MEKGGMGTALDGGGVHDPVDLVARYPHLRESV